MTFVGACFSRAIEMFWWGVSFDSYDLNRIISQKIEGAHMRTKERKLVGDYGCGYYVCKCINSV